MIDDLPLFAAQPPIEPEPDAAPPALSARLAEVEPDRLTPLEALNLVYELRDLSRAER